MWSTSKTIDSPVKHQNTLSRRQLYAGDLVYFDLDDVGFLHAEGFTDLRVGCLPAGSDVVGPEGFSECLFRVYPKLMYEMAKSYAKAHERKVEGEELEALRQKAAHEEASNAKIMHSVEQQKWRITYGQTIQLQHVRSGKFLVVLNRTLADMDKGRLKIGLVSHGSSKAWLTFAPKFKTRTIGSDVLFDDYVSVLCHHNIT